MLLYKAFQFHVVDDADIFFVDGDAPRLYDGVPVVDFARKVNAAVFLFGGNSVVKFFQFFDFFLKIAHFMFLISAFILFCKSSRSDAMSQMPKRRTYATTSHGL